MNTCQLTAEPTGSPHPASRTPRSRAFTLIEMIVVTGIIAVLAALIFPVVAAAKKSAYLRRAQSELMVVDHAIKGYKDKLGYYPPDNALGNPYNNTLFYELRGTVLVNTMFQTLDGSAAIATNDVPKAFGVGGFANCTRGGGDEAQTAQKFLPDLKAGQSLNFTNTGSQVTFRVLGCSFDGPNVVIDPTTGQKFIPWYYNYSSPTNGSAPYDLFVDIKIGSKVYRVSNWSSTPQTL